jgi:TRAP-type mannitol/chloroaromatic compound transport system permease large subunit
MILILMQLSFILMGTFLDDTAMLVIVAPLYVPLVGALGFDLIWYGVLYTITCQIAYMTPPFGYNLFLMRAMAPPEISLRDIYRSIIPFVLVMVAGLGAGDDVSRKSRCGCRTMSTGNNAMAKTPRRAFRAKFLSE